MSERSDRGSELFKSGFNCAQAVVGAFAKELGLDEKTAMKVSAGFGGGVGRTGEICGALSGAAIVAGMLYGATEGGDAESKARTYEEVQRIIKLFKEKNGFVTCRELKNPPADGETAFRRRACAALVEDAIIITEKVLFDKEKEYGKD
jgi:C_GCAxxG_C_C family probable redox protein